MSESDKAKVRRLYKENRELRQQIQDLQEKLASTKRVKEVASQFLESLLELSESAGLRRLYDE